MTRTIYSENPFRMSECAQGGDRSANRELAGKVGRAACKKCRELSFLDIGFMVQANLTSSTTARCARFVGRRFFNDATSWSSIEQQAGVILNCPILPHSQPPPALLLRPSFRHFCTRLRSSFFFFFRLEPYPRRPPVLHALWTRCGRAGVGRRC